MIPPDGYRLMILGEFVPANAIYLSLDGVSWRETPRAGQKYTLNEKTIYACPIGTQGTRIGSETLSDHSGVPEPGV